MAKKTKNNELRIITTSLKMLDAWVETLVFIRKIRRKFSL